MTRELVLLQSKREFGVARKETRACTCPFRAEEALADISLPPHVPLTFAMINL